MDMINEPVYTTILDAEPSNGPLLRIGVFDPMSAFDFRFCYVTNNPDDTLAKIFKAILADKNLSVDEQIALMELMKVSYTVLTNGPEQKI